LRTAVSGSTEANAPGTASALAMAASASNEASTRSTASAKHAARSSTQPRITRTRPFWAGAFSGLAAAAVAAAFAFLLLTPHASNPLLTDLADAHLRSLMPEHLIDVESTDKHTVKPWFANHTDVSPTVADFNQQGYPLIGGRADYFNNQRAAVVVYRHGAHIINVFSWANDGHALPKDTSVNGYHFAFWSAGNLNYCAVSDTAWDELLTLTRLIRGLEKE
jgi:anti-sigma factor RsiW